MNANLPTRSRRPLVVISLVSFLILFSGCRDISFDNVSFRSVADEYVDPTASNPDNPGANGSPTSTVSPTPTPTASSTQAGCAAKTININGRFVVKDPTGYAPGHNSCTPTIDASKNFDIPALVNGASFSLAQSGPLGYLFGTHDKIYCDRTFITLNFKLTCTNAKLTFDRIEVRYLVGRFDENIYQYRHSFIWEKGGPACTLSTNTNMSNLTCTGQTPSFDVQQMMATF